ncbi:type 1 glutamine amidotransferase [Cyanobium sp. CH-040]|uniref:type 1 glutamine amidotransferase n=1 Tax=Cyanobium sp. CH-040 TaxID=2823708 RepID=UPI0020CC1AAB|nr:type 1 glutamine amidotransferase [Cyanobium sp. CH-040]MCP9928608.1 type 1 glutamine amidotransferase [Cyanobium sp. CH-040]
MPARVVPEILVLQHQELVGAGSLPELVAARGWTLRLCRLHRGDPLPPPQVPGQILVVLGGTMGVADREDPGCPWMGAELGLIAARLRQRAPVLGLCLGAQMLAHAAGGRVEPLLQGDPPRALPQVGCGAVQWLAAADREPVLAGLQVCEPVFFWHGDRVRLPAEAVVLGSSLACREQAFRIGPSAWGLQFHAEITPALARSWVAAVPAFVRRAHGPDGVERVMADLDRWGEVIEARNRLLLGNLLDQLAAAASPGASGQFSLGSS